MKTYSLIYQIIGIRFEIFEISVSDNKYYANDPMPQDQLLYNNFQTILVILAVLWYDIMSLVWLRQYALVR